MSREEQRRTGKLLQGESHALDGFIECLHRIEGQRQFGVDHRVDEQLVHLRLYAQLAHRPFGPRRIIFEHVEQDVGVNEHHRALFSLITAVHGATVALLTTTGPAIRGRAFTGAARPVPSWGW